MRTAGQTATAGTDRFLAGLPLALTEIVFELSEHTDGIDVSSVSEAVSSLRARGARIALGVLGAGAQEVARLAVLRPAIIKIDRSHDEKDLILVADGMARIAATPGDLIENIDRLEKIDPTSYAAISAASDRVEAACAPITGDV